MNHHHLDVSRSARFFTLGAPSPALREVWFVLHGYGQLAEYFIRHFRPIADDSRLIVAPEALSRFYLDAEYKRVGASWMTRDDRERDIADNNAYLETVAGEIWQRLDPASVEVHVLGFSQGGATASRWAATSAGFACHRLILWASRIASDLDGHAAKLNRMRLTYVAGDRDPYLTPERARDERAWLDGHGIAHTFVPFEGEHRMNPDVLRQLITPAT
ncbi:MAG: hypothetical protein R2834_06175 [Rhodothermales bacterium]